MYGSCIQRGMVNKTEEINMLNVLGGFVVLGSILISFLIEWPPDVPLTRT